MNKYYLRIEDDKFGFVVSDIHNILETDIAIDEIEYNRFFELQSQGKQFRLKAEIVGNGLFDIVEEFVPVENDINEPTLSERVQAMEELILTIL